MSREGCGFVLREACCVHSRRSHVVEIVIIGDPDDAGAVCRACEDIEYDAIRRREIIPFGVDSDHRYRATTYCGKAEHAPLYPHESHARIYGHDYQGQTAVTPSPMGAGE